MTHAEDRIIASIDRSRGAEAARGIRCEREREITEKARATLSAFAAKNDVDLIRWRKALIREAGSDLALLIDPAGAASFLSQQAHDAGRGIMPRKMKREAAERLFTNPGADR